MTQSAPGPDPDDDAPALPAEPRDGTLYVQGMEDEDAEPSADRRVSRGGRASTVLTALLVAVGLALPGVAVLLRRPTVRQEPGTPVGSEVRPAAADGDTRPPRTATEVMAGPGVPPSAEKVPRHAMVSAGEAAARAGAPSSRTGVEVRKESAPARVAPTILPVGGAPVRSSASPLDGALARVERQPPPSLPLQPERLRAAIEDVTAPPEARSRAALALLDAHANRERWRSLARDAERISRMDLPRYLERLPAEQAAWLRIHAARNLEQWDAVLRMGPTFRQTYPDSTLVSAVDAIVRSTHHQLANQEEARRTVQTELRAEEERASRDIARLEALGQPSTEVRRRLDRKRCVLPAEKGLHAEVLAPCRAFLATWPVATTPAELNEYRDVRGMEIKALVGLRRYAEARERLAAFLASDPEGEPRTRARAVVLSLPAEAEE